jgi:hypothetical protein
MGGIARIEKKCGKLSQVPLHQAPARPIPMIKFSGSSRMIACFR